MPKVSVIGAGNVGADLARRVVERDFADVTLIDIVEGLPQGKALDLRQAGAVEGYESIITGTNDWKELEGSEIVAITAGLARKPGMSREDLLAKNAEIIGSIVEKIFEFAPRSIILMVTNPLDVMTHLAYKKSGFDPKKVLGMAGQLDTARMKTFISIELNVSTNDVEAIVLGSHGDLMVPLPRLTKVKGKPLSKLLSKEKIDAIVDRTRRGGAEIVKHLKTGSAFYAPAASAADMVEAMVKNSKAVIPSCVYLKGEYGLNDIYMGVPAELGKEGVMKVVELDLTEDELKALRACAEKVRENISKLKV